MNRKDEFRALSGLASPLPTLEEAIKETTGEPVLPETLPCDPPPPALSEEEAKAEFRFLAGIPRRR